MSAKPPSALIVFFSALFFGAGCLMAVFHGIWHAPEYLGAYFTKVEHPIKTDYAAYGDLLKEIVRDNRVDYALAHKSAKLDKAMAALASTSCDEFENENEKLLYWVNAYNLLVVKTVADHFPVASVNDLTNYMSSHRYTVGGVAITAKDVRQLKIAPMLRGTKLGDATDARMILMLAGGAMGYPVLCDHPLMSNGLIRDLEDNTYKFLHRKTNVYITKEPNLMLISSYFQWNESVLQAEFTNPWNFVLYYLPKKERPDTSQFNYHENYMTNFDWRINDIATKD